jgi:hypothetical protein
MARGTNYKSEEHRLREKAHQFGQPDGNPTYSKALAVNQREFYRWCESTATLPELKEYAKDATKPAMRRNFVKAILKTVNAGDPEMYFQMTNQTHGAPKQPIEVQSLPKVECEVFGKDE